MLYVNRPLSTFSPQNIRNWQTHQRPEQLSILSYWVTELVAAVFMASGDPNSEKGHAGADQAPKCNQRDEEHVAPASALLRAANTPSRKTHCLCSLGYSHFRCPFLLIVFSVSRAYSKMSSKNRKGQTYSQLFFIPDCWFRLRFREHHSRISLFIYNFTDKKLNDYNVFRNQKEKTWP